ncbi:2-methylaconitate cis-trans isomerase PrpF family protein, partial [Pseudomonas aeruginosa]|uniref:2-methylaconitate cis-trans isomerase PrpF family protein n=1 Tax=Pseudomonas aeruginosa TaxID=287 RepID=UPI0021F0B50D
RALPPAGGAGALSAPLPHPLGGGPGGGPPPPPAAIPGTLVNLAAGGGERSAVRFGHPSGTLRVGAEASQANGEWTVTKAIMSRSARILMEGWVRVPGEAF